MGLYYEVKIDGRIAGRDSSNGMVELAQGKNSEDDYEEYYMEHGKAKRYSLEKLMPTTSGGVEDISFIASYKDDQGKDVYVEYRPTFFNGRWWVEEDISKGVNE